MEAPYPVENKDRLGDFMFQTSDNSQLLRRVLWTNAELTIVWSLNHKNTQPSYNSKIENPQKSETQNGPRKGLDFIALRDINQTKKQFCFLNFFHEFFSVWAVEKFLFFFNCSNEGGVKKWQNSVHVVVECPLSRRVSIPTHSFACDTGLFPGLCCTDFIFCLVLIAIFVPFPVVHFPKESNIVVWVPKSFQLTWILFKPVTFCGEIRTLTREIHSCIFCTLFAITVTLSFFFLPFIFDICEFVLKV